MIRTATIEDMPRLLQYADAFLSYHPLTATLPREMAAVEGMLGRMIDNPSAVIFVHDHGVIGGIIVPIWCAPKTAVATELFWWAERNGIELMRAFEDWACASGADIVQMLSIAGRRSPDALYVRAGYAKTEVSYVRAVR